MSTQISYVKFRDSRRLYNKTKRTYATLKDVLEAVQAGKDVSVMACSTRRGDYDQDITVQILIDALRYRETHRPQATKKQILQLLREPP